jgi:hypothetical protein
MKMARLGEHNINIMAEVASSAAPQGQRPEQTAKNAACLPTRTLSKEDIELAEHLVDHSQGLRENEKSRYDRQEREPSGYEYQQTANSHSGLGGHGYDQSRQLTPTSAQSERNQPEESYSPHTIISHDSVPSGQVCR